MASGGESGAAPACSLRDVAAAAGVAVSTVSRALDPDLSDRLNVRTRDRVRAVARRMHYCRDLAARRLKKRVTETLTLGLPLATLTQVSVPDLSANNHVLLWHLIQGVIAECSRCGFDAKILPMTGTDGAQVSDMHVGYPYSDGAILVGREGLEDVVEYVRGQSIPFLVVDTGSGAVHDVPAVQADVTAAVESAVASLLARNHRRIGYLGADVGTRLERTPRFAAYHAVLSAHGVFDPELAFAVADRIELRRLVERWASERNFTAMLCVNDVVADGLIREAAEVGIAVPRELAVIGFDDNPVYRQSGGGLSTIDLRRAELGAAGARRLLEMVRMGRTDDGVERLEATFIQRATS